MGIADGSDGFEPYAPAQASAAISLTHQRLPSDVCAGFKAKHASGVDCSLVERCRIGLDELEAVFGVFAH